MRRNRPNDFRASGSGESIFDSRRVDRCCVETAFRVVEKLNTQSLHLDILFDSNHEPRVCEISYCSSAFSVHECPGYWDREFGWHEGHFWPEDLIIADVVAAVESRGACSHNAEKAWVGPPS
jgi:hypothetical protein